jgi:putative transposase
LYYKKRQVRLDEEKALIARIQELYSECPFYGFRKMVVVLKEEHFKVGKKKVKALMNKLNIKAIYPKKKFTTISNKQHKKYKYLLKEKDFINKPNSVWASDITYVKLEKGFAYFCAVIVKAIINSSGKGHLNSHTLKRKKPPPFKPLL